MRIRGIVLTLNEDQFIGDCLRSMTGVVDDILVIDAGSTDHTTDIARSFGAQVLDLPWLGFARARNVALDCSLPMDWILFVDADERIPPALAVEIRQSVASASQSIDGFLISRRNVVCGKIMQSRGWWPDYQLRLMRPNRCRYGEDTPVHEFPHCSGKSLALNHSFIHLNYRTWSEFFRKQIQYARLMAANSATVRRRTYLGAPTREFIRRFITQLGFLDGFHGFRAAALISAAELYRVWLARRAAP